MKRAVELARANGGRLIRYGGTNRPYWSSDTLAICRPCFHPSTIQAIVDREVMEYTGRDRSEVTLRTHGNDRGIRVKDRPRLELVR